MEPRSVSAGTVDDAAQVGTARGGVAPGGTAEPGTAPLLAAAQVSKAYPGVVAVRQVDLAVRPGEVVGLIGENGAGKSTLVRILAGIERPDRGSVLIDGTPIELHNRADAVRAGVGVVMQHSTLIPTLTGLENLLVADRDDSARGRIDFKAARARIEALQHDNDLVVDLDVRTGRLAVGEQQRLEVLKCLRDEPRVVILDEPTAVLNVHEIQGLMDLVRRWAAKGIGVVLISHKLEELLDVTERIVVLRKGQAVAELPTASTTADQLAAAMVGEATGDPELLAAVQEVEAAEGSAADSLDTGGPAALHLRRVSVTGPAGTTGLAEVDLTVPFGAIVGVAGIDGNGQRSLVDVISGVIKASDGTIELNGTDVTTAEVQARLAAGLAVVNEDRSHVSGIASLSVLDNVAIRLAEDVRISRFGFLGWRRLRRQVQELLDAYGVRAPLHAPYGTLSGGNQQRVVLARELGAEPSVLVAEQPTQGLDVHGVAYVHRRLADLRQRGAAVLLVSSELDEVLSLSDHVVVIQRGRIVGTLSGRAATRESVARMMVGEAA